MDPKILVGPLIWQKYYPSMVVKYLQTPYPFGLLGKLMTSIWQIGSSLLRSSGFIGILNWSFGYLEQTWQDKVRCN